MWQPLTEQDVTSEVLPDEAAALQTIQGANDTLSTVLLNVILEIQSACRTGGNLVDQPGNIPDLLRGATVTIARWRWFCGLPDTSLQSKSRKAQFDEAQLLVSAVRKGEIKVDISLNPQNITGPSFRVSTPRRGQRVDAHGIDTMGATGGCGEGYYGTP